MTDQALFIEGQHLLRQTGLVLEDAAVNIPQDGTTHLVTTNMSCLTSRVNKGTVVGEAQVTEVITLEPKHTNVSLVDVWKLSSAQDEDRRKKMMELFPLQHVPEADAEHLHTFLANNHDVFCL